MIAATQLPRLGYTSGCMCLRRQLYKIVDRRNLVTYATGNYQAPVGHLPTTCQASARKGGGMRSCGMPSSPGASLLPPLKGISAGAGGYRRWQSQRLPGSGAQLRAAWGAGACSLAGYPAKHHASQHRKAARPAYVHAGWEPLRALREREAALEARKPAKKALLAVARHKGLLAAAAA